MNTYLLDDLLNKLTAALPKGADQLGRDMEKNLRAALRSVLVKMDLVTREEFEIQQQVLGRSRAKLEALQQQVGDLETQIKHLQNSGET